MNKILIFSISILLGLSSCSQVSLQDRRKTTMLHIVECIKQNDTVQLQKLIDTSFNKVVLDFDIAFLHRQLVKKDFTLNANDFHVEKDPDYYKVNLDVKSKTIESIIIEFHFSPGVSDRIFTLNKSIQSNGDDSLKGLKTP